MESIIDEWGVRTDGFHMMVISTLFFSAAWHGPVALSSSAAKRATPPVKMGAIKGTRSAAQAQIEAYFEMAPWEKQWVDICNVSADLFLCCAVSMLM